MTPDDPLSQLRDIHLPIAGGFWPPAPGWWILGVLLLIAVAALIWAVIRRHRRNRWLRLAKAELAILERSAVKEPQWFTELNALLKRVARARYPNENPEAQTGEQWAECLIRHLPEGRIAHRPVVDALINSAWQPEPTAEPAQAMEFARIWLDAQKC
ncbi:DUF4381 domain-containing protein [uncultured Marinobacter sp.]|uniref:DUF4381 domain-containing protein n=1 Tax=uncultured Marinobacter sp. TaxID=187379 RepID=UPI0026149399|nr:DUF4381 domain-containing protein [uncultured Marinobacter sp.]